MPSTKVTKSTTTYQPNTGFAMNKTKVQPVEVQAAFQAIEQKRSQPPKIYGISLNCLRNDNVLTMGANAGTEDAHAWLVVRNGESDWDIGRISNSVSLEPNKGNFLVLGDTTVDAVMETLKTESDEEENSFTKKRVDTELNQAYQGTTKESNSGNFSAAFMRVLEEKIDGVFNACCINLDLQQPGIDKHNPPGSSFN